MKYCVIILTGTILLGCFYRPNHYRTSKKTGDLKSIEVARPIFESVYVSEYTIEDGRSFSTFLRFFPEGQVYISAPVLMSDSVDFNNLEARESRKDMAQGQKSYYTIVKDSVLRIESFVNVQQGYEYWFGYINENELTFFGRKYRGFMGGRFPMHAVFKRAEVQLENIRPDW